MFSTHSISTYAYYERGSGGMEKKGSQQMHSKASDSSLKCEAKSPLRRSDKRFYSLYNGSALVVISLLDPIVKAKNILVCYCDSAAFIKK